MDNEGLGSASVWISSANCDSPLTWTRFIYA